MAGLRGISTGILAPRIERVDKGVCALAHVQLGLHEAKLTVPATGVLRVARARVAVHVPPNLGLRLRWRRGNAADEERWRGR